VRLHGDTSAIICCYEEIDNEEYLKKKQNKTKPLKQQSDGRKKQTSNNVNKGAPLFKLYMNKYQLIDKSTTSLAFFVFHRFLFWVLITFTRNAIAH
jgi:hypothetical protein